MIMPFGKHKGEDISEIEDSYLQWLIDNCEDDEIQQEAEEELNIRRDLSPRF